MPAYFITHPDVLLDPSRPVERWPLSERGRARMHRLLELSWSAELERVFSSSEQKALDGAEILAGALGIPHSVLPGLGENDRSATGFLPPDEFWRVVDDYFACPGESIRGWERASDAQKRIVAAVREGLAAAPGECVAFVSHGGVGTLLHCHLKGVPISRSEEQPRPEPGSPAGAGGGFYLCFEPSSWKLVHSWRPIDP